MAWEGWLKDDAAPNLKRKLSSYSRHCPCEPIPPAAGDLYASLKVAQQTRGVPLDENDLWIAATALAINATLVSRDSDFQRIEGIAVVVP